MPLEVPAPARTTEQPPPCGIVGEMHLGGRRNRPLVADEGVALPSKVFSKRQNLLLVGDAGATLRMLPEGTVRTVVTSPPYWSLRDYEVDGQIGMAEPHP